MTDIWPIPARDELRTLPLSPKTRARGLAAWFVFTFLRAGRALGNAWCTVVYEDYVQEIGGVIYHTPGRVVSESTRAHESCHEWQRRTVGVLRFLWRYYLTRRGRQHAEAMAYALEVAHYGRDPENAAGAVSAPAYRMGWTRAEARSLIDRYAEAYLKAWPNPARWE